MGNSVEPMSEGAGLAHGEEDPDRSMEKPKAWKHMKKTIATRPQKRKSEYSMVLEERKARRLRLTGYVTKPIYHSKYGSPPGTTNYCCVYGFHSFFILMMLVPFCV